MESHFSRLRMPLALHVLLAAGCISAPIRPPVDRTVERAAAVAPDRDNDGVADAHDQCPLSAEDRDGFQDDDGCPEIDNDGDGITDLHDLCPCVPENHNQYEDMDGCPECGAVLQTDAPVRMDVRIVFEQDSARLTPRGARMVQQIALTFGQYEQLHLVAVQGHAIESEQDVVGLAAMRADAVADALTQYGVAPARLVRESMGAEFPLEGGSNAPALERSRRVMFEVREHAIATGEACGDAVPMVRGCGGG